MTRTSAVIFVLCTQQIRHGVKEQRSNLSTESEGVRTRFGRGSTSYVLFSQVLPAVVNSYRRRNYFCMKHSIHILVMAVIALSSCQKDMNMDLDTEENGVPAIIKIDTRSGVVPADNEIISLRIIAFAPGGTVRSNKFYSNFSPTVEIHRITHEMNSGIYDFVFIANENNGSELAGLSAFYGTKAGLNTVTIPASSFNNYSPIPMLSSVDNVKVLPGNSGVVIAGIIKSEWDIGVKKLGIRFDMILKSTSDLSSRFGGVIFSNLPDNVPVKGEYSGVLNTSITYEATDAVFKNYVLTQDDINNDIAWGIKMERVILPSHLFSPASIAAKAMKLTVIDAGTDNNPSTIIGFSEANNNYTLPPDTYFNGVGIVKSMIELNLDVDEWTEIQVDGNVNKDVLNVSALEKLVVDNNTERIYFNSNQSSVVLEALGRTNSGSYIEISTFLDYSIIYNSFTGAGYLDLTTKQNKNGIYKIYLKAGNTKREITTVLINNANTTSIQINDSYVGTFHRWNETGERRITLPAFGASSPVSEWVAIAESDLDEDWIAMDDATFGHNSGVLNSNAKHYIYGNANYAPVKFRVGIKGEHPDGIDAGFNGISTPRYGIITIYYGNNLQNKHRIFVRQGEVADHLMKPTDSGWGTGPLYRPNAVKITPYNLTDPNPTTGGSNINNHNQIATQSGVFVEYPSRAGHFFQWMNPGSYASTERLAFHPTNSVVRITGWLTFSSAILSDWNNSHIIVQEGCPVGYRRFADSNTATNQTGNPNNSELRQSLWLSPVSGNSTNINNSVWGFLADGYFDRHPITKSVNNINNSTVDTGTNNGADVAYIGRLFFNPNSNASIFFPAAGYRDATGALMESGYSATLWSCTRYMNTGTNENRRKALACWFQPSAAYLDNNFGDLAISIRCVKN